MHMIRMMRAINHQHFEPGLSESVLCATAERTRSMSVQHRPALGAGAQSIGVRHACGVAMLASIMLLASCKNNAPAAQDGDAKPDATVETTPNALPSDLPVVTSTGQKIDRVTLENGLIIEDLQRGTGQICLPDSTIRARYSCRVRGGKVFDSTGADAVQYELSTMIRGWQEGLPGMQVGGTRRLIVPPELGYGERVLRNGEGTIVAPANSTLEYVIDLVEIK